MQTVDEIARQILRREGGYVNDPNDPGGATNFGVTIHTMRRLGLDITGDGNITNADVRALSQKQALDIFMTHYFKKTLIDKLPNILWASVFDMYVNSGSNAVRILQKLLRRFGKDVAIDGQLGPLTIAAAHRVLGVAPDHLVDAYGIARRNYYYRLADRRAASRKYARSRNGGKGGWIRRAEEFIAEKYHYSVQDHQNRTTAWG